MTLTVAAGGGGGVDFHSSKDSDPTPPMTLCKYKGSLTQFVKKNNASMEVNKPNAAFKKTCICAPTSHAGSFRCHLHRTINATEQNSEEIQDDKDESSGSLDSMKMAMHRKFSYNKPQLSRFGQAAALAVNNVSGNSN